MPLHFISELFARVMADNARRTRGQVRGSKVLYSQKYYTGARVKSSRAGTSRPPLKALFDHFTSDLPTPAIPRFAYLPHHHTFAFRELFLQLLFQECALVKAKVRDGAEIGRTGWQVTDSCAGIPCDHLLRDTLWKNTPPKIHLSQNHPL